MLLMFVLLLQLIPESLFLAIYILDRFLSEQEVERKNLQLVRSTYDVSHCIQSMLQLSNSQ